MKRRLLYIILTLFLIAACTPKQPETYMLRPHEDLPKEVAGDKSFIKIFLAGTIDMGNSRDWQMEIYERFCRMEGRYILFNPRQEHWDASRPGEMDYQVRWDFTPKVTKYMSSAKGISIDMTMSASPANTMVSRFTTIWERLPEATAMRTRRTVGVSGRPTCGRCRRPLRTMLHWTALQNVRGRTNHPVVSQPGYLQYIHYVSAHPL